MDWEGKVSGTSLRCTASGRVIAAGEEFFSALRWNGTAFVREDFCGEAWNGLDHAIFLSWWKQHAPRADEQQARLRLDGEALLRIFNDLKDATERSQQCFCFVVALALMRSKVLRLHEVRRDAKGAVLVMIARKAGVAHLVRDPGMDEAEQEAVHRNLLSVVSLPGAAVGEA